MFPSSSFPCLTPSSPWFPLLSSLLWISPSLLVSLISHHHHQARAIRPRDKLTIGNISLIETTKSHQIRRLYITITTTFFLFICMFSFLFIFPIVCIFFLLLTSPPLASYCLSSSSFLVPLLSPSSSLSLLLLLSSLSTPSMPSDQDISSESTT